MPTADIACFGGRLPSYQYHKQTASIIELGFSDIFHLTSYINELNQDVNESSTRSQHFMKTQNKIEIEANERERKKEHPPHEIPIVSPLARI